MIQIIVLFGTLVGFAVSLDSTTTPTVVQPCRIPRAPTNGSVIIWGFNVLLEYTCDPGLFLIGSSFGSCNPLTKRWSIERPLCVSSDCEPPGNVTNGRLYYKHNGSIVTTVCNHGYRMIGTRQRHCNGYKWVGITARCKEKYASLAGRRQARDKVTTTPSSEDIANQVLEEHIRDADNSCYKKFTEPPVVEYASVEIEYKFNAAAQDWVLIAKYTCALGYMYSDKTATYLYCKNYQWIGEKKPECVNAVVPSKNPCLTDNGKCEQICVHNTGTSYKCDCYEGYHLGKFKRNCEDIDECEFDNGGCWQNCVNIIGSYFCTCNPGYVEHGTECYDVDECANGDMCDEECINTLGSYECTCTQPGYQQAIDKTTCIDYDECKMGNDTCDDHCVNTVGSYQCTCLKKGYRLDLDGHTCVDVDECERYKKPRCLHGQCVNTRGSYRCTCDLGYRSSRSRKKCFDINECKVDNGGCSEVCTNTIGTYTCDCHKSGYIIQEGGCVDNDECGYKNGGCEDVCINADGSYKCSCTRNNYQIAADGHTCIECTNEEFYDNVSRICVSCPAHSIVHSNGTNSWSKRDCVCLPGYDNNSNDGCIDIDECTDGRLSCDQLCVNTPGSAHCDCRPGYMVVSPSTCTDIDECLPMPCSHGCNNTDGSYNCYCSDGFYLGQDNHTCIDNEECVDDMIWCEHQCINTVGSAYCTCDKGYILSTETNNTCDDIDECEDGSDVCEDTCINTVGSYRCDCLDAGLKLSWDLASCSDINECMEGENDCENGCINTRGSYQCICNIPGYVRTNDQIKCQDKDECQDNTTNTCSEVCINTDGAYMCDCFSGHALISFDQCAPCSVGYYRDNSTVECEPCPVHTTTSSEGSTGITDCVCMEGYTRTVTSSGEGCILTDQE